MDSTVLQIALRLALAALLGGVIGWERESRKKVAGLRTNMLVTLGAATFTLLVTTMSPHNGLIDPGRIVTGVATGIGFLGAGSIIRSRGEISGITTAATIWVAGGIGAACGVGAYPIAIGATLLATIILRTILVLERRWFVR